MRALLAGLLPAALLLSAAQAATPDLCAGRAGCVVAGETPAGQAADGTALLPWPAGGTVSRLTPLPNGRALASHQHGPWLARPCLWLDAEGSLRVAGHRARILQMQRA